MSKIFMLIVIYLAFFCAYSIAAQSQWPSPSTGILSSHKKPQAEKDKNYSQNDQRGTEQCPIVVKIAPSPNAQVEAPQAKNEKQKRAAAKSGVELVTIIIAFATAIQAGVLIWTVIVMIRTTRRQLRAYVFVSEISIYNVANPSLPLPQGYIPTGAEITRPNEGPLATMVIKNTGQTPAYDVICGANMCIQKFQLISSFPPLKTGQYITKTIIPTGGTTNKAVGGIPPLTPEEIDQLRNGTMAIYVHGTIKYRDTFRKRRFTNFRFMHFGGLHIIGVATALTICNEGNEAN